MMCRFVGCLTLSAALALVAGCANNTPSATQPASVTSTTALKQAGHRAAPVMEERGNGQPAAPPK